MSSATPSQNRTQYWQTQIDAWRDSGQTQLAFCKANGLNYPRFGYWLRKFRQQSSSSSEVTRQAFVPVQPTPNHSEGLTVRLPNGVELRGISADNLPLVEQLMARCV